MKRTSNRDDMVTKLYRFKMKKRIKQVALIVAGLTILVLLVGTVKWNWLPFPRDAGPTEVSSHVRLTEIEQVDFQCHAAVTSVFAVTGYNPGWKLLGFIHGGEAYVAFDVVGDLDLCIWGSDYTLSLDQSNNLVVDVERIDVRRPRIDLNPRKLDGTTYQTLKLNSLSEQKLANANIDRVLWEATRNLVKGTDKTYIDEMEDLLLQFGENSLADTSCFPLAIQVMEDGVYEHFMRQASLFGYEGVIVNLPEMVAIPVVPEYFDPGQTVFNVVGEETCYVVDGQT